MRGVNMSRFQMLFRNFIRKLLRKVGYVSNRERERERVYIREHK